MFINYKFISIIITSYQLSITVQYYKSERNNYNIILESDPAGQIWLAPDRFNLKFKIV